MEGPAEGVHQLDRIASAMLALDTPPQMTQTPPTPSSRRVAASDDLEVSAYLEIAQEKRGRGSAPDRPAEPQREAILIVDFGSQYSRLIARRVRESKVYCEIIEHDAAWESVEHLNPRGVILSGGPASVYEPGAPTAPPWVYDKGLPVLGICYGMQVLVHRLGGEVAPSAKREYGHAVLHRNTADDPLFSGLPASMPVWMSHGDRIMEPPPGFETLAYTENSPVAAIGNRDGIAGIQFHPEVVHTPDGKALLDNFVHSVCGCRALVDARQLRCRRNTRH